MIDANTPTCPKCRSGDVIQGPWCLEARTGRMRMVFACWDCNAQWAQFKAAPPREATNESTDDGHIVAW